VDEQFQRQGIARKILDDLIEKAISTGAKKIQLSTNSQLQAAIKLYNSYGFKQIPLIDNKFLTADLKLELELVMTQD